ncbi:uncharacterized protein C1235.01-like [Mizuhopecten yessoensis]|uniref:uncharacterized protein C1235.01-like n=1 Tax=Mizuhopecten yessoensis TaxID=6573 RepID=UPI000B45920D|nr:uncharacterized protein C1235.01-like [Mizuhopecten yessoensis]
MKLLIFVMMIGDMTSANQPPKRDISHDIGVYASLRPFSMMECVVKCGQSPICNSVLLEVKTKTCFLNRNVTKGSLVSMRGYKYSEKADPTKPERVQQCFANFMKEMEACSENRNNNTTPVEQTSDKATMKPTSTTTPITTTSEIPTSEISLPPMETTTTTAAAAAMTTTAQKTTEASITTPTAEATTTALTTTTEASVANTEQPCPDYYQPISKFDPPICCRIELNPASYSEAESFCKKDGSAFVLPDSLERLDAIKEAIFEAAKVTTTPHMIWIDASRISHDGTWKTGEDGPFDYDVFLRSNFDSSNTNEGNCLGMLFTPPRNISGWLATNCSTPAWYVCTPVTASSSAYDYP